jgi:hypothetical protein
MGAAQSAGGAATSGAKISGMELTHAIREAARKSNNASLSGSDFNVPTDQELQEEAQFTVKYGDREEKEMKVTNFAPTTFAKMRAFGGVTDEHFIEEWTLPKEKCEAALGEGRSMALFLKSLNMDFMCKTIAKVEMDVLRGVLGNYAKHLHERPNSLIMRYLMLLQIEANDDVGFLLIFSDVFSAADRINERWDVKGRVPKPGKFHHFPPKSHADKHHAGQANNAVGDPLHHDGGAVAPEVIASRFSEQSEAHPPASPTSSSIRTRKDKELTRLFWFETDERDQLLTDLNEDFSFLASNHLMDYSILVGVRYTGNDGAVPAMRQDSHLTPPLRAQSPTPERRNGRESNPPAEVRPARSSFDRTPVNNDLGEASLSRTHGTMASLTAAHGPMGSTSRYHAGLTAMLGEETYYIAIIDALTLYNSKKMSANFFKGFLWEAPTLSTIEPEAYRARISKYSRLIFASPDDDLTEVQRLHNEL